MTSIFRPNCGSAINILTWLLFSTAVGCGDDEQESAPSLAGLYSITSYTQNTSSCEVEGGPVVDVSFLRIVHEPHLAVASTVDVFECATQDECGDVSERYYDWSFDQETSTGWSTTTATSSYGVSNCLLSVSESTLLRTDSGAVLTKRLYSDMIEMEERDCEPDAVTTYRDQLSCVEYRVLVAERVD